MTTAVLSIGANLGDRRAALQGAVDAFRPWLVAVSPVYETPPWGPVPQDDYLNAVLVVRDEQATAQDWLVRAHAAEQSAGRVRDVRWGPRSLDVDVIAVDDVHSNDPVLTLPHPRAAERAFVLVPWRDVQPDARLDGIRITDHIGRLDPDDVANVRRRDDEAVR
ncbi:MAG TPA: 2-amino-4-hydroxy-6-hydroxymethyldihydropteridine diphosphokinase [Jatrophihabitantaceae bacterium]|nr:2-amino-4-hydroxy-6-hydroxymethyldihydropteridine diphosphokinase [Jatrophihabitantaceae bacterium]